MRLQHISSALLPTHYGTFEISVFRSGAKGLEHVALVHKKNSNALPLVRVHSQCLTGDSFGSLRCDCGPQLAASLKLLAKAPFGVLLYLNQEGRGIGLGSKIKAYALQDTGLDTVQANEALGFPADGRRYDVAAQMLKALKINKITLLTNNPDKECQLFKNGITVVAAKPIEIKPQKDNRAYLKTKKTKMGHRLRLV